MASPADDKYAVHLVAVHDSANDQDKLDSLVGDGPLQLSTLHVLAKALPQKVIKIDGDADGRHDTTQHLAHRPQDARARYPLKTLLEYGKAAASIISIHTHQPPPGHDPVRVSYPWAPMC